MLGTRSPLFPMTKVASYLFASCVCLTMVASPVFAQDRIYRCGNEYTNNASMAKERGCKVVEGGNVTVIEGTRPAAAGGSTANSGSSTPKAATSPASAPRVNPDDQKARDADARAILQAELKKSQARLADLKAEYNNGAPQRNALDLRNPQVYMERTESLKSALARAESDVGGIQREIDRLGPTR